jgi:hypothetical protein
LLNPSFLPLIFLLEATPTFNSCMQSIFHDSDTINDATISNLEQWRFSLEATWLIYYLIISIYLNFPLNLCYLYFSLHLNGTVTSLLPPYVKLTSFSVWAKVHLSITLLAHCACSVPGNWYFVLMFFLLIGTYRSYTMCLIVFLNRGKNHSY